MKWKVITTLAIFMTVLLTVITAEHSTDVWSKLQLSSRIFASIPFATFRINIYEHVRNNESENPMKRYYYAPLSLLNRSSTVCRWNNITEAHEISFSIHMWTSEENAELLVHLEKTTGFQLSANQLQVVPFERVTLKATENLEKFRVPTQWKSYVNQQQYLKFIMIPSDRSSCQLLTSELRDHPDQFEYLHLYFGMESHLSKRREIAVSLQNIMRGSFFQQLQQQFPENTDGVYLTVEDERRFLSEASSNIVAENFGDLEILDANQEGRILFEIRQLLASIQVTTKDFTKTTWDSVYWPDVSSRPDKVATRLSEQYNSSNDQTKLEMRVAYSEQQKSWSIPELAERSSFGTARDAAKDLLEGLVGIFRRSGLACAKQHVSHETDGLLDSEVVSSKTVQWSQDNFVPKLRALVKVNFTPTLNVPSRIVKLKYSTALLQTNLNYLPESATLSGSIAAAQTKAVQAKTRELPALIDESMFETQVQNSTRFSLYNQYDNKIQQLQHQMINYTISLAALETQLKQKDENMTNLILQKSIQAVHHHMVTYTANLTALEAKLHHGRQTSQNIEERLENHLNHAEHFGITHNPTNQLSNHTMELIEGKLENYAESLFIMENKLKEGQEKMNNLEDAMHFRLAIQSALQLPNPRPCDGTKHRAAGYDKVMLSLNEAPVGTVCVGNERGYPAKTNFLVFTKQYHSPHVSSLFFLGTQSTSVGFNDFTKYVSWSLRNIGNGFECEDQGGCHRLPHHLLHNHCAVNFCTRGNPNGHMRLLCADLKGIVYNDGSVACAHTYEGNPTLCLRLDLQFHVRLDVDDFRLRSSF